MTDEQSNLPMRNDDPRFPDCCNRLLRNTTPGSAYRDLENEKPDPLTYDETLETIKALERTQGKTGDDPTRFDVLAAIHYSLHDRDDPGADFLRARFLRQVRRFYVDRFWPETIGRNPVQS